MMMMTITMTMMTTMMTMMTLTMRCPGVRVPQPRAPDPGVDQDAQLPQAGLALRLQLDHALQVGAAVSPPGGTIVGCHCITLRQLGFF